MTCFEFDKSVESNNCFKNQMKGRHGSQQTIITNLFSADNHNESLSAAQFQATEKKAAITFRNIQGVQFLSKTIRKNWRMLKQSKRFHYWPCLFILQSITVDGDWSNIPKGTWPPSQSTWSLHLPGLCMEILNVVLICDQCYTTINHTGESV